MTDKGFVYTMKTNISIHVFTFQQLAKYNKCSLAVDVTQEKTGWYNERLMHIFGLKNNKKI